MTLPAFAGDKLGTRAKETCSATGRCRCRNDRRLNANAMDAQRQSPSGLLCRGCSQREISSAQSRILPQTDSTLHGRSATQERAENTDREHLGRSKREIVAAAFSRRNDLRDDMILRLSMPLADQTRLVVMVR